MDKILLSLWIYCLYNNKKKRIKKWQTALNYTSITIKFIITIVKNISVMINGYILFDK